MRAFSRGDDNLVVIKMRPGQPQEVAEAQACMSRQFNGMGYFYFGSLFDACDIGLGPDDLSAIGIVELLDALAWVPGDLAKLDGVGQHARKHLQAIVRGARLIGPLAAPPADYGSDFLGSIKLSDAQVAEVFGNSIEPRQPIALR
jgi:hypothetical protein